MNKLLIERTKEEGTLGTLGYKFENYGKEKLDVMRKETVYQIIQLVVGPLYFFFFFFLAEKNTKLGI